MVGEFIPRRGCDFTYTGEVDPLLLCGLCHGPLYQPQETACSTQHYYCRICIEEHIKQVGPSCPDCLEPLSEYAPFQNTTRLVKQLTGKLAVRCNRRAHDKLCGAVYPRDGYQDHARVCEKRQVSCPRCREIVFRCDLEQHEATCSQGASGFGFQQQEDKKYNGQTPWAFATPGAAGMDVDSPNKGFSFVPPNASELSTPPLQDGPKFEIGTTSKSTKKRPKHVRRAPVAADVTMSGSQSPTAAPASPKLPSFSDEKPKREKPSMWASDRPIQSTPVLPVPSPAEVPPPATTPAVEPKEESPPPPVPQPPAEKPQMRKKESIRRSGKERTSKKLKMLGDDAYEKGDYDAAIELWTQAVDLDDGTTKLTVVYGNRSAARFMSQQYNECINDCKLALEDDKTNAKLWNRMAKAACSMGKIDLAIMLLKSAVQDAKLKEKGGKELEAVERELLSCHTVQRAIASSNRYLSEGKVQDAEGELQSHQVTKYSDWPEVVVALAKMCIGKKHSDQALQMIEKTINVGLQKPSALDSSVLVEALYVRCKAFYLKGFDKMKEAIMVAQDGLAIAPDHKNLAGVAQKCRALEEKKEKGNERFRAKEWVKSAQLYTDGLELAGDCPEVAKVLHTNRAAARKEMKQFKLAVEDCTSALALDPTFARAYTRRGRCHIELNDFEKAIADFKSASRITGPNQDLSEMLRDAERRKDAKSDFYTLLGASHSFSNNCEKTMKELKMKYKELCLRWHPDKIHSGNDEDRKEAEKKIKQINEAYATLTDPVRRREYDKTQLLRRSSSANFAHTFGGGSFGSSRFGGGYGYSSYGGL